MKKIYVVIISLVIVVFCSKGYADDSESNPVAKSIKQQTLKALKKYRSKLDGYCDVMIEMKHVQSYAEIVGVGTNGDYQICAKAKSKIKIGKKFKYKVPEKYIRIQINAAEL
ncbi:hypothetical protein B9J80_05740 [Vibrio sp. V12_P9A6T4]|uniref:hypothetical protein n=1 Tax=Vibrio sp. V12_P9A6T4 TaxID=1938667 RepID=UPI000B8E7721|nr:hypothetical protein [Vibrio sp. V12_P9A6T4]OXX55303.1 hypothetical protein B9J80_05740 [Vibrio sp. V12_P9A6T4]